jgi:hypothetical protein
MNPGSKKTRFQVRELAQLLSTDSRRIEGWVEQELLHPTVSARGPGHRREFDLRALLVGATALELQRTFGVKSAVWAPIVKELGKLNLRKVADAIGATPTDAANPILAVAHTQRRIVRVRIVGLGELAEFAKDALQRGSTVTLINLAPVLGSVREWIQEHATVRRSRGRRRRPPTA